MSSIPRDRQPDTTLSRSLSILWQGTKSATGAVSKVIPRSLSGLFATTAGFALLSTGFAVLWNHTEHHRMARAIERGDLFSMDVLESEIDTKLLPFDFKALSQCLERPYGFSCIVGPKSTGKSCALDKIGNGMKNVVKIKTGEEGCCHVSDEIVSQLHKHIWHLPLWWRWTRIDPDLNSTDIVKCVFKRVQSETNTPVTVLFDLDTKAMPKFQAKIPVPGVWVPTDMALEVDPSKIIPLFSANQFTREVKFLSSDLRIMRCLFVASEGLPFQDESAREPRLDLFLSQELSVDAAKSYLKQYHQIDNVNELHLKQIPHTFEKLRKYAMATDKEVFAIESLENQVFKVKELPQNHKDLLKKALTQKITPDEYQATKLSKEDVRNLVNANLLYMNKSTSYEIQFDVVREAIKKV